MRALMKTPRKLSLVRFNFDALSKHDADFPFQRDAVYVFLGAIANMPGHCVVADYKTVRSTARYTRDFVELTDDEV